MAHPMKKKILIALGLVVLAFAGLAGYELTEGQKRSPKDTVSAKVDGSDVTVTYSRPFKKNRVIFGDKASGAVVQFGQYWRLGANAATTITFSKNVEFAGKPVVAGSYAMYAVPGASSWKVVLNSEHDRWGAREVDHAKDVLSVEVPAGKAPQATEQFTITVTGNQLNFVWDTTSVSVPVKIPGAVVDTGTIAPAAAAEANQVPPQQ